MILLLGLVVNIASITVGEERNVQGRGETRRLSGAYIRRRRPAAPHAPPYAVSMEPLVKYSQRDPLYDRTQNSTAFTSRGDYESEGTNNVAELAASPGHDHYYHPHQYYQEPEPIIEIIIKESNESLPAPTTVPPPPPTKEPVHVFYVKYKKNPNASGKYGESDVIYEPPIPAVTQHESDTVELDPDPSPVHVTEQPYLPPPPSTTLRTIIRPDSEIYHGSGLKVTFGSLDQAHQLERREHELEESASEIEDSLPDAKDQAQNRDSTDIPAKPHYFKRQQGTYFPPAQPPQNLQQLTPPAPIQQFQQGPPPNRQQIPNRATQAIFNQGNPKPNHSTLQATPPFRSQQHNSPSFQRNQQFSPNQNPINQQVQSPNNFPPNQTPLVRQPQRYNEQVASTQRQPVANPEFRQRTPPQTTNNFNGNETPKRQQFQPTLEAQIEEYQKHKLFLHQQNLRHQALQQAEQAKHQQQVQLIGSQSPQHPVRSSPQPVQYHPLQPIHVQAPHSGHFHRGQHNFQVPKNEPNIPNRQSFSSHASREPVNVDLSSRNQPVSQNFVTPQPINNSPSFNPSLSLPTRAPDHRPFVPSPQHIPHQKQSVFIQPSQATYSQPNTRPSDSAIDYLNHNKDYLRLPKPIYNDAEIVKTISPIEDIQVQSDGDSGNKVPTTIEQNTQNEENIQKKAPTIYNFEDIQSAQEGNQPDSNTYNNHKLASPAENHRYEPVYSSTTPKIRPTFTSRTSTTSASQTTPASIYSIAPSSTTPTPPVQIPEEDQKEDSDEESPEQMEKKKANLAALPDEVPEDLRQQLLSSGILGNADIQILDYDKVGDIPIESLPPEALENLYGAGSEQVASVVKPDSLPNKKPVEMKVVRYDPNTQEGQGLADTYVREDATQLDPVVLNDSRYNRYLPLKISGSHFPLPDVPQLKGRIVNSVVVLAPVDYDFIKSQDDIDRSGRTIQVEGVRFIAGDSLKTLVKDPTLENYNTWLSREKETPARRQSVVLLVTSPTTTEKTPKANKMDIFMYDVATGKVSKLRGELSSTFVEVAESNSGSEELDELASSNEDVSQPAL